MLEIRNLTRKFGNLVATNDVSLQVKEHTIHGLIGPNGAGKSTLMNLITGFLKPTSGSITLEGKEMGGQAPHYVAKSGVVRTFQLIKVFGEWTVRDNVRVGVLAQQRLLKEAKGGLFNSSRHDEIDARVASVIDQMGLQSVADRVAGTLPGGIQRTLSVATALATGPRLLLLDEPLAGLNATEKSNLAEKITMINRSGVTILLVEHDVKTVMLLCEIITVINFGRKIGEGSPNQVMNDKEIIEAYLGVKRN